MTTLILPLSFFPGPKRSRGRRPGRPSGLTLRAGDGTVLLTRENFHPLIDELGERGLPRFHIFDTRTEARAAQLLLEREEMRLRGAASPTEIRTLRDGEGALMILHKDRPVTGDGFEVIDHRIASEQEVRGSWEVSEAECDAALSAPPGRGRGDLALAVAAKLSSLPAELMRDVQIAMGRVPGAYAGFVSVSPEEVRASPRLEGADPDRVTDALIQPFLTQASSEAPLGGALTRAVDVVVDRMLAAHPDLVPSGSDTPEP